MKPKQERIHCDKCSRNFASVVRLETHKRKFHKPLPPPPPLQPAKIVKVLPFSLNETLHLTGGDARNLDLGDVFYHVRRFVIRKITKVAGEDTVTVEAECLKRVWRNTEPI